MGLEDIAKNKAQVVAALAATLIAFGGGTILGWSSPSGTELTNPLADSRYPFTLDDDEEFSWVGSAINIGAAISCVPIGLVMNKIGRKWTLLILIAPALLGWGLLLGSQNLAMMIAARFFLGIFVGSSFVVCPVYVSEISEKSIRGTLGTLFQLQITIGILFVYAVGMGPDVFWLSLICTLIPAIFGVVFCWMPETSTYLVNKNKIAQAEESLRWLRGKDFDPKPEIDLLQEQEAERNSSNQNDSIISAYKRPEARRAMIIGVCLMFFQQTSGINAVIFYTTFIFGAANTGIEPAIQTIIVGVIQVLMTFVSTLLVDRLGRRVLLLASDALMSICTIALGAYFWVLDHDAGQTENLGWLPLVSLSLFIVAFSVGFGPLPFLVISEVSAPDVAGVNAGVAMTTNWVLSFFITKFFTNMVSGLGTGPTFWLFSAFSILGTAFVFFFVPETKGLAPEKIWQLLGAKNQTSTKKDVIDRI